MRLSLAIATKGRPDDLRETLASLAECDPPPSELVVVDGDEGRSAEPVVRAFEEQASGLPPVRYEHTRPGLTRQRNVALELVTGDVVVFVDDDVRFRRDMFARLARVYEDPAVVGATGRVLEPQGRRFGNSRSAIRRVLFGRGRAGTMTRFGYPRRLQDLERSSEVEFMQGCLMSARLPVAREVGFDERLPGYGLAEDEDFSYRLSRRGRVVFAADVEIDHKNTGGSGSASRAFNRQVVVNRTYLFRKNFPQTRLARIQFAGLIGLLAAHRAVNLEWQGLLGLADGVRAARRLASPEAGAAQTGATEQPVRVAFISSHAHGGGSERYLELLLDELGSQWLASVIVLQDGPFADRLRDAGYPVEVVPTPARLGIVLAAWRLRRTLLRRRPDVVHANGVKAALSAVLATTLTRVPVIWVKHDFSWDGPLARLLGAAVDEVVAVSGAITTTFGARTRRRVRVVPNGLPPVTVDKGDARRRVADLAGTDGRTPVVSLIGRQHPAKGQIELIEAAPAALEREPRMRFLLVGGEDPTQAEYARALRRRVDELGLGDRVVFTGHLDDPLTVMAGSDVVVLPSVPDERGAGREACPFALLEAMAVGTPVVAYAAGGIPEVLGDCGRLVLEGDRDELARSLADLAADTEAARELSSCASERVGRSFQLAQTVEAMRQCYSAVARS